MSEPFAPIMALEEAMQRREIWRREGCRVVLTNGCFDLIHSGHVTYLAWARERGDRLIVALNTDASVRALKGRERPFVRLDERARVIAALRSVDLVVAFDERTPEALIERLRPDIHVKSSQYRLEDLPERNAVLRGGGEVVLAPHEQGFSTTDLVAIIRYGGHDVLRPS